MNGGAARLIQKGECVAIMAFGLSEKPIVPKKLLCNEENEIIRVEGP
jgi:aspartate 1-decarboxylase